MDGSLKSCIVLVQRQPRASGKRANAGKATGDRKPLRLGSLPLQPVMPMPEKELKRGCPLKHAADR